MRELRAALLPAAVFRGGVAGRLTEAAIEGANVVIPHPIGDLGDGERLMQEQLLGGVNAQQMNIVVEVDADFITEHMREIEAADAETAREVLQTERFVVMLVAIQQHLLCQREITGILRM